MKKVKSSKSSIAKSPTKSKPITKPSKSRKKAAIAADLIESKKKTATVVHSIAVVSQA